MRESRTYGYERGIVSNGYVYLARKQTAKSLRLTCNNILAEVDGKEVINIEM
ncbi:MAG: hypothetical protein IKD76_05305 [Clostridia bacterium]|nr:hypothetical protein [Clostridia bacterium]